MLVSTTTRGLCTVSAAIAISVAVATAETITVTDIAGPNVEVEQNPDHIVLGEGRMIYSLALLDRENPFDRVVLSRFSSGLFRAMFAMKEIENGNEIHGRVST